MCKKPAKKLLLLFCLIAVALFYTGCGNKDNNMTNEGGNTATAQSEGATQGTDEKGTDTSAQDDANDNIGDDIGNAAEDVADGVGDAVEDMTGVDYGDYNSANDYLMGQLGGTEGQYEIRNEDKELKNYDTSDTSKMGYRYEVYDTSKGDGEQYGIFYVDKETGKIYKESGKDKKIEEYKTKE